MALWKFFLQMVLVLCISGKCHTLVLFCYYPSWAHYRDNIAKFDVPDVDPFLCTHLIFAFGKINKENHALEPFDHADDGPNGKYKQFNDLKEVNPDLKTLLSIGGESVNSDNFLAVASTEEARKTFAQNVVQFLRERNFDGFDVNWEYPTHYQDEFDNLLKSLREAFDAENSDPEQRLILTAVVAAGINVIETSYNIGELIQYVDYLLLMCYDYHGPNAAVTSFNSPLYSQPSIQFDSSLSTNWTVHYYNDHGVPYNKMVVGITGVGRRLTLADPSQTDVGSPTTGEIKDGPYYFYPNGLAYPEICELLKDPETTTFRDSVQGGNPYLANGATWVGYEDQGSIHEKMEWIKELNISGVMFWALDQDDFSGEVCGDGKFPLLNTVKSEIDNHTHNHTGSDAPHSWAGGCHIYIIMSLAFILAILTPS